MIRKRNQRDPLIYFPHSVQEETEANYWKREDAKAVWEAHEAHWTEGLMRQNADWDFYPAWNSWESSKKNN